MSGTKETPKTVTLWFLQPVSVIQFLDGCVAFWSYSNIVVYVAVATTRGRWWLQRALKHWNGFNIWCS